MCFPCPHFILPAGLGHWVTHDHVELASARSLALAICNIIQTSYLQYTIKLDEHKTIARFVPTSTPLFRPMEASYCVCKVYCGWRYEAFAKDERDITTIVANSNISEVVENDSPQGNSDHWGLLQSRHCCHQYPCSLLLWLRLRLLISYQNFKHILANQATHR